MHGQIAEIKILVGLGTWKIMPFADLGPSSTDENKIPPKQDHPQDKSGTTDLDIAHAQKRRNEEKVQSMLLQVIQGLKGSKGLPNHSNMSGGGTGN